MNIGQAVTSGFKKYIEFGGRACRSEYWYWFLFVLIVSLVTMILDSVLFSTSATRLLNPLSGLALFLPGLAVGARRLHDIDKSGWWLLLWIVPFVGWIIMIIWAVKKGPESSNRFGADPLGTMPAEAVTA